MCMDDINIFAKNVKDLETLTLTSKLCSQDIETEFETEKCAMLIMK